MEQPDAGVSPSDLASVGKVEAEIESNLFVRLSAAFWDFLDNRQIVRRVMTLGTFGMVVQTTLWAQRFVETTTKSEAGVALMLGAVTAPITGLMGYMFTTYQQSRKEP